jgi:hypothetical protein
MEAGVSEFDYDKIPLLEGYYSSTAARGLFKVSKQGLHAMIASGKFDYDDLRRFDEEGRRRILLSKPVVDEMVAAREVDATAAKAAAKEAEKARFLRDVRLWARSQGIRVRNDRPIPATLVRQYRKWLKEQPPV